MQELIESKHVNYHSQMMQVLHQFMLWDLTSIYAMSRAILQIKPIAVLAASISFNFKNNIDQAINDWLRIDSQQPITQIAHLESVHLQTERRNAR